MTAYKLGKKKKQMAMATEQTEVYNIKQSLDTHEYNLNHKTIAQTAGNNNNNKNHQTRLGKTQTLVFI